MRKRCPAVRSIMIDMFPRMYKEGMSCNRIGDKWGVDVQVVSRIVKKFLRIRCKNGQWGAK